MGEYGTLVSVLLGALGLLIGALAAAWVTIRKQSQSEKRDDRVAALEIQKHEDMQAKVAYDILISNLTTSMQAVVSELKASQKDHVQCIEAQAILRGQVDTLLQEVKELRQWRHDLAGIAHQETMKQAADSKLLEVATAATAAIVSEQQSESKP